MPFRPFIPIVAACLLALSQLLAAASDPLRVTSLSRGSLESTEAIRRAMTSAAASGVTDVLVPIAIGLPSASEPFDAPAEALKEAATRNLRAHAWLDVGRAAFADDLPSAREHVTYQHPDWLMVPRDLAVTLLRVDVRSPEYVGRLSRWTRANAPRVDGLYLSPVLGDAVTYISERVADVVKRYPVAGVHFDALHFPGADFDFSRRALEVFRAELRAGLSAAERSRMDAIEEVDPFAYPEEFPDAWQRFRQSRLTALVAQLSAIVRSVRPDATISVAVTAGVERAINERLQDWRTWMDNRYVDAITQNRGAVLLFSYETLLQAPTTALTSQRTSAGGSH